MLCHSLLASTVSDAKLAVIWIGVPYSNMSFLSGCLQDFFFFTFSFQKCSYDVSSYAFLGVYPIWVFLSFLNLYVYIFCQNWQVSAITSSNTLQSCCLPFLLGFQWYICGSSVIVFEALCVFFQSIFSLLLRLGKCYFLFIDSILCHCHCTTEPSQWDFYFC